MKIYKKKKGGGIYEEDYLSDDANYIKIDEKLYVRDIDDKNECAKDPISYDCILKENAIVFRGHLYDVEQLYQWFIIKRHSSNPLTRKYVNIDDKQLIQNKHDELQTQKKFVIIKNDDQIGKIYPKNGER